MYKATIEEIMKSTDLQQLQYLAAVRVAISACESEEVQNMIGRFRKSDGKFSDYQWKKIREKVQRKLNQIGVPDLIIDIIVEKLWRICNEISKWILYHVEDPGIHLSPKFCWTRRLNIDYVKTAEILVRIEEIDIKKRFKLACFHCLDSDVRSLWDQMSLSEKRSFFVRGNLKKPNQNPIVLYWTYYIQEAPVEFWDSEALNNMQLLTYAVQNGYLSATKFYLGKLKESRKDDMISSCVDSQLFKLSYLNKFLKEQFAIASFLICQSSLCGGIEYIANRFFHNYFLYWPMQKYFITVYNRLRQEMCSRNFRVLLKKIIQKDLNGYKDYNYKGLFMEFWLQGSDEHKRDVTELRIGYDIFEKFVKKYFGFLFEEYSFEMKAKFRVTLFEKDILKNSSYFEKSNVEFFKFLVRERVTNKDAIKNAFLFNGRPQSTLPLEELINLIDGILETELSFSPIIRY